MVQKTLENCLWGTQASGNREAQTADLSSQAKLIPDGKAAVDKEWKEAHKNKRQGKSTLSHWFTSATSKSTSTSRGMFARVISSVDISTSTKKESPLCYIDGHELLHRRRFFIGVSHRRHGDFWGFGTQAVATTVCATGVYTHSPVARTFFRTVLHTFTHLRACTFTHGSSVCKKVCCMRMWLISISPSPFSCFTLHPCSSLTVTSRPRSRLWRPRLPCRTVPDPKARVKRTSARAVGSLATWPIPRSPQVMSPTSSTRSLLWTMTRCSLTIQTSMKSLTSRKNTRESTGLFGVPRVFEASVSHVSHGGFWSSERKQRKHASGNRCKTERVLWSVLQSRCQGKVDGTGWGVILFRLTESSFLINEISENTWNERPKVWNEETQNVLYLSHNGSLNLKDYSSWRPIKGQIKLSVREYTCPRIWRIEKPLLWRGKHWKTTKIGRNSYATWSGITHSESILLRSWITEQLWRTYVPHQALLTSSSRKLSREVGMPRNTRENMSIPGNVLIVNMLDETLMNCTLIQEIWQHHRESLMMSRILRTAGIEKSESEEPLQSIPLLCLTARARQKKSRRWKSVFCLWFVTMPRVLGPVLKVAWQFRVISPRRCIWKIPWPNGISKLDREFPSRSLRKSEESRARIAVDQEIEAISLLKDLINPKSLTGEDFSNYEESDLMMAAELKWCYDIVYLIFEIT